MILQQKQTGKKYALSVKPTGKVTPSLSIPGQAFNINLALQQYKKGNLTDRVAGYYESEGMDVPDFNMMTNLEKLEELAKYRKIVKEKAAKLDAAHTLANQKYQKDVLEKQNQKESPGERKNDSGEPPKPK